MANPNRPVLTVPAAKTPTPDVPGEVTGAPVTEVVVAPGADVDAFNAARAARFITTTGDAPVYNGPSDRAKLNAKTLAEHAAGKQALAQYGPAE